MGILVKVHCRKWGLQWASSQNRQFGEPVVHGENAVLSFGRMRRLDFPLCAKEYMSPGGQEGGVLSSSVHIHLLRQIYSQPKRKLRLHLQGILFACLLRGLFFKSRISCSKGVGTSPKDSGKAAISRNHLNQQVHMKYIGKDKYQVINYKNKITAKQKQKQKKTLL